MAVPSGFVSQITYFDLRGLPYSDFIEELVLAHALLQRKASEHGGDDELILFNEMQWWYSFSATPASYRYTPRKWSTLADEHDYQTMLQHITSYLRPAELTVEFTNNLSFVNCNSELPVASYPTAEHILEDGNSVTTPIYPCFLRLSKAAILSLPPARYSSPHRTNEAQDLVRPNPIRYSVPQGFDDAGSSSMLLSSDSKTLSKHSPSGHRIDVVSPQGDHISLSSSLESYSSSPLIGSPICIEIRTVQAKILPIAIQSLRGNLDYAPTPPSSSPSIRRSLSETSPAQSHPPTGNIDSILFRPPTQLRLCIRPSSSITRRYSDRFDPYTAGLDGSSRAEKSRPGLHNDRETYLDLVGFAGSSVAVGGSRSDYPLVDIERTPDDRDGNDTSVLWNELLYALVLD